jgi:hypothetical protein
MPDPKYPGLTRVQEKKLKLSVEGKCELCSEYFALQFLEIHRISLRLYQEMVQDPSTRILVVCHPCHQHIHCLPVRIKDQAEIVSRRSFFVREDIRRTLRYTPKSWSSPGDIDVARIYEDYFYNLPPGSFRLGG